MDPAADPLFFSARWRVRSYELDQNGHVNNAVYLNWAEEIATEHAEAAGYGRAWSIARGGGWLIRKSEIVHHRPAVYDDQVEVSVRVERVRGVRAVRHTWIRRAADSTLLAEVTTEWVWVRLRDGRPAPVPAELLQAAAEANKKAGGNPAGSRKSG
ncbi:MAG TPA: acyl-CoA thioesterase [Candidatus Limnocylindrales bacterium]|nr:acyl-CoA thioesterase [Candidatus Limnocylindrales bacterium]